MFNEVSETKTYYSVLTVVMRSEGCVPAPWMTRLSVSENIKRSSPE